MSKKHVFLQFFSKITIFACVFCAFFISPVFANLPAGYTELEYIESTGTQYIDTEVSNGAWEVLAQTTQPNKTTSQILFHSNITNNDWAGYNSYRGGIMEWGELNIPQGEKYLYTGKDNIVTDPKLFSGNTNGFNYYGRVWYAKIRVNGILVRDFVPARRNSDGEVGMYDTVSNTFFTNAGTGSFIAGPVVVSDHCISGNTGTCTACEPGYVLNDGWCESCPAGYSCAGGSASPVMCATNQFSTGGMASCSSCTNGLTTSSVADARYHDEAADCGCILHVGAYEIRLKSIPTTGDLSSLVPSPSLRLNIAGNTNGRPDFYANISTTVAPMRVTATGEISTADSQDKLVITYNNINYYVCDDVTCVSFDPVAPIREWLEQFQIIANNQTYFGTTGVFGKWANDSNTNARWQCNSVWRSKYIDGSSYLYSPHGWSGAPVRTVGGMYQTLTEGKETEAGTWAVEYETNDMKTGIAPGVVYGVAKCTSVAGTNDYSSQTPTKFSDLLAENQIKWAELPAPYGQANRTGYEREKFKQCWCKMTAVGIPDENGNPANGTVYPINPEAADWVFASSYASAATCAYSCAVYCMRYVHNYAPFRTVLFDLTE